MDADEREQIERCKARGTHNEKTDSGFCVECGLVEDFDRLEPTNVQKMGEVAQAFMEHLEGAPSDAQLGAVIIVAEVNLPANGDEDRGPHGKTLTTYWSSDLRGFVQLGLLRTATLAIEQGRTTDE